MFMTFPIKPTQWLIVLALLLGSLALPAAAHCDAVDGPVAKDVNLALADGQLDRVLKWVTAEDEAEVRRVFGQARHVRELGDEAAALADRHFLETVVRLHRLSEGATYTGLVPAGQPIHPAVHAVDHALASDDIKPLIEKLQAQIAASVTARYAKAQASAAKADQSVESGRESVHDYVELVHFVKHLHELLHRDAGGHGQSHGDADEHADVHVPAPAANEGHRHNRPSTHTE